MYRVGLQAHLWNLVLRSLFVVIGDKGVIDLTHCH
jgi:hypothetical protein